MTAARRGDVDRLLARWDPAIRLLLLAGPDESRSRELAGLALAALTDPTDPLSLTDLTSEELKSDPSRLADEAASVSMFGGRRVIRVSPTTEGCAEAARLLLQAPVAGNPVVMLAGDLAKTSGLRKLAEENPAALAVISYPMAQGEIEGWLKAQAKSLGLKLDTRVPEWFAASSGGDLGVLSRELEKFALFLDADPENPKLVERRHLGLLGADNAEEDLNLLVQGVVMGDRRTIERQFRLLSDTSAIPALRAVARRMMQLAEARVAVDRGLAPIAAVKALRPPVFWKEQDQVAAALAHWPVVRSRRAIIQMLEGEAAIKRPGGNGDVEGWQAILSLG